MAGTFQAPAAQVYLREAGLSFNAEHIDVLHYDHALHLLLVVRRHSISIYNEADSNQSPQVRMIRTDICLDYASSVQEAASPGCSIAGISLRPGLRSCWPEQHALYLLLLLLVRQRHTFVYDAADGRQRVWVQ